MAKSQEEETLSNAIRLSLEATIERRTRIYPNNLTSTITSLMKAIKAWKRTRAEELRKDEKFVMEEIVCNKQVWEGIVQNNCYELEVPSSKEPDKYWVNLSDYNFNGSCNCPRFICQIGPEIAKVGAEPHERTRCAHIRVARLWIMHHVFPKVGAPNLPWGRM
jgi:hypothetical protein